MVVHWLGARLVRVEIDGLVFIVYSCRWVYCDFIYLFMSLVIVIRIL